MNKFYRTFFDTPVNRQGTHCEKIGACEEVFGRKDILPMWVADMDFRTVPAVTEALVRRAEHGVFGYTANPHEEKQAEIGWLKRRYGLGVGEEDILYSPGVVDSIFFAVRAFTQKGDKILIQTPVYGPFYRAVDLFERTMVKNPLIHDEDGWRMDFDLLERQMADGVKMMILCNPHNPVGRVWRREELERVAEIARRNGVIIVSDEIHADFNFGEIPHTRILSIGGGENCVMLTSATKSFNLAGLRQSSAIIRDPDLRARFSKEISYAHAGTPNIFGGIAQMTAYREGDEWMDSVTEYIRENRDLVWERVNAMGHGLRIDKQTGTYLMWLDARGTGMTHEEFFARLINTGHVGLSSGMDFGGEDGRGFFRINLATTRINVLKALEGIERSIDKA